MTDKPATRIMESARVAEAVLHSENARQISGLRSNAKHQFGVLRPTFCEAELVLPGRHLARRPGAAFALIFPTIGIAPSTTCPHMVEGV